MGKAKERRKRWRARYLAALKESDPERFKRELDKRLISWSQDIWELAEAGNIKDPRVFGVADQAEDLTTEADQPVTEILEHECCKALSVKQGMNKSRMTARYGRSFKTAR